MLTKKAWQHKAFLEELSKYHSPWSGTHLYVEYFSVKVSFLKKGFFLPCLSVFPFSCGSPVLLCNVQLAVSSWPMCLHIQVYMGINGFLQAEKSSLLAWKMLFSLPGTCPYIMLQFFSKQLWPRQPRVIWVEFSFQHHWFMNQQSWWSVSSTGESKLALQAPLCKQAVAARAQGSGLSPGGSHTRQEQQECSLVSCLLLFQLIAVNRSSFHANLALLPPQQCLSSHPLLAHPWKYRWNKHAYY